MVADRNYLALFVAESGDQLEKLSSELVALEQARESVPAALWDSIFRRIHSIKGSAATLELTELVGITHAAEELIARLREIEGRNDAESRAGRNSHVKRAAGPEQEMIHAA